MGDKERRGTRGRGLGSDGRCCGGRTNQSCYQLCNVADVADVHSSDWCVMKEGRIEKTLRITVTGKYHPSLFST